MFWGDWSLDVADHSKGWVKILRSIQEHPLWKRTPYDKARAWVDLILTANHKDNKIMIGNQTMEVKSGELITSQRKLSERWGWSRNTVRTFLVFLKNEEMLELKTTHELSHLTILNYNYIQKETTHELSHEKTTNRATPIPPLEHKQEYKNVKNEKNKDILSGLPDLEAPILYLNEKTKSHFNPKNRSNQDLVRARQNEGRTLDQFKQVIDKKVTQWFNDEKMMKYLRPSTLFNRTNFENYLNEPVGEIVAYDQLRQSFGLKKE